MVRMGHQSSGACFSECMRYRYSLWRTWTPLELRGRLCCFIGLNPSTATHEVDDPTIRRCMQFCKDWGFDGYVMLNLFGFRATDPQDMKAEPEPEGPHNIDQIKTWAAGCEKIICAWGVHGSHLQQGAKVARMLSWQAYDLFHLGLTKGGHPKHPLYLKKTTIPAEWAHHQKGELNV